MIGKVFMLVKDFFFVVSVRFGVFNIVCVLIVSRLIDDVGFFVQMFKGLGVICISIGMGKYYDFGQF